MAIATEAQSQLIAVEWIDKIGRFDDEGRLKAKKQNAHILRFR